jgi:YD repeat-containing protein
VLGGRAIAAAPLCDQSNYCVTTCVPNGIHPGQYNVFNQFYWCATGGSAGEKWDWACDPATFVAGDNRDTACLHGANDGGDVPDNGRDDNANGCIDEGSIKGEKPCECTRECAKLACGNIADCDPSKGKEEICNDGEDNNCNELVDDGCKPPDPPPPPPPPLGPWPPLPPPKPAPLCQDKVGKDPIMPSSRAAVTEPFTDFTGGAWGALSLTRTWMSTDASLHGGASSSFGPGWRHQWEGWLACTGDKCTVMRAGSSALAFTRAEVVASLDGLETWQLYRPPTGATGDVRSQLLALRPGGDWLLFQSDGYTYRYATACDACSAPDVFCTAVADGGKARLVEVIDPAGNSTHVTYGRGTGLLLGLTDALGHTLELKSATAGDDGLARSLSYDGMTVATYEYDAAGLLQRAVDADGQVLRGYLYDPQGTALLKAVLDESGAPIVEFAYDENGDATGIADEITTSILSYAEDGTTTVSEAFGATTGTSARRYDRGNLMSVSEGCSCGGASTWGYSGSDRVCATNAAGESEWDVMDALGRITRHRVYAGTTCPPSPLFSDFKSDETRTYGVVKAIAAGVQLDLDRTTSITRKSTIQNIYSATESWDYDPAPKSYDPVDYACAEAPLPAGGVLCRHIEAGMVRSDWGPLAERHATFFSYDGRGRLTRTIGPVNLDRPSASDVVPVEERIYWPDTETLARRGRLAELRRYPSPTAAPHSTTFDYDAFGVYRTWQPDGAFSTWIKDGRGRARFVLHSDGRTSETRHHDGDKPRLRIGPAGEVDRTGYDNRGRVIAEERLSGDPDVPGAQVSVLWGEYHQYDPAGNRTHSERRDGTGAVVWKVDREFDIAHRLVRELHPDLPGVARTWEYRADGFMTRTTDEEGRATTFAPEYLGRVKSVGRSGLDANGLPVSLAVATYGYAPWMNLLGSVVDGTGKTTTYYQDDFGRLAQLSNFNDRGGMQKRYFDARGNLLERTDNSAVYQVVKHTYDGLNRVLTTTATTPFSTSVAYTYRYDENGALGRLTSVVEPERTVRFTFDAGGRLQTERLEENGISTALLTEHVYDAAARLKALVYPTGLRLEYDRDPVTGNVTTLRDAGTGLAYAGGVTRLAAGPLTGFAYGNGTTQSQGFNARWETTSVAAGPVSLAYTPTPAGDVGQIVENGLTLPFGYDFLDRLTSSTGWFTYGYDGDGNRTGDWLEGTSLTYVYANDRVKYAATPGATPVKRYAFAYDYQSSLSGIGKYDAAGSAVTSAMCLLHDSLGRLVLAGTAKTPTSVTPDATNCFAESHVASVTARFKYDHRNRRVASWRATTNEWVYTVFDQAGQPLAELAKTTDPANPWRAVR